MSQTLILNQNFVLDGLDTLTYTVPAGAAGLYNVAVQTTVNPFSTLSIVVNKNGSPVFTAPVIGQTQIAMQFKVDLLLAAADVITVVFSSGDGQLNTIKSNVSIGTGT